MTNSRLARTRDSDILESGFRNFVLTLESVQRLFFQGCQQDAVRKVLDRLSNQNWLVKYPLFGRQSYYRLGRRSITRWNYPIGRSRALGAQRLPYELGTLAWMCFDEVPRKRLLRMELQAMFPWFPESQMTWAYYIDHAVEPKRLVTVRVETRLRAERAIEKIGQQVHSCRKTREFSQLLDDGLFGVVVITASPEQELAIRTEADDSFLAAHIVTAHYLPLTNFT